MIKHFKASRLLFFIVLALLVAACGGVQQPWAGITKTEQNEVYVSYDTFIAKLDAQGDRLWAYPDEDDREGSTKFYANVTVGEGVVYIGDYLGGVHAVNSETGDAKWVYKIDVTRLFGLVNFGGSTDRVIAPVAVGENVLYVPDEHGVFLLDKATGKPVDDWSLETERAIWSQPIFVPASDDLPARLFVTSLDHHLYSLNTEDGSTLWKTDLEGAAPSQPTFDSENNLLFVGTFSAELLAIDAATGEVLDRFEAKDWLWGEPALADGNLYFGDLDGYLYALTFENGEFQELWSRQIEEEGKIRATPLVVDNLLVIGTYSGSVYGIERATGNEEWHKAFEDTKVLSTLIQVEAEIEGEQESLIIVTTENRDQLVVGLRLDNGNERWSYEHKD